jgi:hypothetical protein
MDRRAVFFVLAAVLCFALRPLIPIEEGKPDIRWVGVVTGVAFVVLALLSWLDHRGRQGADRGRRAP